MTTYPRPPLAHDDGDDMIFQITDWFVPEADRDWMSQQDPSEPAPLYEIIIYGVTDKGNSVTVKVKGFEPYFFVKLPAKNWSAPVSAVRKLEELLRSGRSKSLIWDKKQRAWAPKDYATMIVPRRLEGHLSYVKCVKRKDFWGFTNERKFHFAKVKVKSLALFNALKKYFNDQWLLETGYQPYESNIDPFIRFIHERNIAPCGWVRLPGGAYTNMSGDSDSTSFSRTQIAVEVNHEDVHPMNINKIAPLLIASFDIECTSSHGDFPVALKDYRKLAQDLVGAVVVEGCANEEDIKGWLSAVFSSKDLIATRTPKGAEIARVFLKHKPDIAKLTQAINEVSPKLAKALAKASAFAAAWEEVEGAEEGGGEDDGDNKRVGTLTQQRTRVENEVLSLLGMATDYGDIRKDGAFYAFPLKGDAIIQIGTTVHRYGSDEIVFKHIATLDTCDAIEDAIVDSYETEAQMLLGWKDMFAELDPDILIGYNIFGFDMDYMWKRAKELGQDVVVKFGDGLGRLTGRCIRNVKEQKLSSSALGDNFLKYFPLDGVVNVDLLKVMQRDQKLDSYKLDSVAAHFLGDHKNDLKPREIFEKFGGSSADRAEIARYCLQDCALVNRLLHKLKVLENNAAMGNVCSVPLSYLFMRGQGIKIFSLVSKECRAKQMVIPVIHKPRPFGVELEEDTLDAVGYEGAIVLDPQEGMYLDTPITVLDYASLYPTSMIERNLSHDCFVMDETYKEEAEASGTKFITVTYDIYEGMGDKKHKTGVQNCTFAQLQPDADGNERRGTIPEILIKLINQRKNTRKKIEYETVEVRTGERYAGLPKRMDNGDIKLLDVELGATKHIDAADIVSVASTYSSFEQAVLDALQLAYKVTANSLYGQIGARTSQIYWKDIAACTTATGRERIMMAKSFVEKEYGGEVIYGDTDSIFIKFPTLDASQNPVTGKDALPIAIAAGQRAAREIKRILPKPQSLEYEKTLFPFILFSKKRYVGNLYEDDANKKPKQKSMGIVLKRRDNAQIVKIIYGGIIDLLMKGEPLEASVDFLKEQLQNLVEGRTPMDELIVTKTLRGYYKNPQQIAHKVLADRMGERDAGNKPAANDRVPYVYVVPPPNVEVRLQGDRIEHPDYIKEHGLTPDYRHYITNQIMKPVCQLYALCVEQLPGYAFAPSYWMERADELEEHGSYKGNPKKIKDRITAVKMRVAEELLFEPFVSQLANVTVGTKKLSSRAKMLTRILGPPKAVPMPHGAVGGPIQVQVKVDMEKGKGYVLKVTTKLGEEAWEGACLEKSFARKRPYTKTYLTVLGAEKALEYISREKEDQARAHGIAWTIADKTCIRLWKKTLECVHELDDKIRKAEEEGDIAANEDLQELTRFSRLAWAREVIGYTLN